MSSSVQQPVIIQLQNQSTTTLDCSICYSEIVDDKYELECNHAFHTSCIINWFRIGNGACPMCRNSADNNVELNNIRHFTCPNRYQCYCSNSAWIKARKNLLKSVIKRKDTPKALKNLFVKLDDTKLKYKIISKQISSFKKTKEYKNALKLIIKCRKLTSKRFKITQKNTEITQAICNYPIVFIKTKINEQDVNKYIHAPKPKTIPQRTIQTRSTIRL